MATYSFTGSIATYTVANTGTFKITAYGGQGGAGSGNAGSIAGGSGAKVGGYFNLTAGDLIEIVVGGEGGYGFNHAGGGGGGGTFVIDETTNHTLLIAGGGGGGGDRGTVGSNASTSVTNSGAAGSAGTGNYGGGGGGHSGGTGGRTGGNAATAGSTSGYAGGAAYTGNTNSGAFGGGGGGSAGGGGGGGDGGGAGGNTLSVGANITSGTGGGGGGSYIANTATNTFTGTSTLGPGEVVILCFLRGTRILTPAGEALVEDMRIGDKVVTRFGGIQPVKWIGRQSHKAADVQGDHGKLPVCIRAGALGDQMPARDLFISPGHSMLVDGNLLIGRLMVNGITITQDWSPPEIEYYHLELETHDCVIAEGAWAETFADYADLRAEFHNAAEFEYRYPENGPPPDQLRLCAPRPEQGPALYQALRPVVTRAAAQVTLGGLCGSIDRIEGEWKVYGWAHDSGNAHLPVLLNVELEGAVIGTVLACERRSDLAEAGFGAGRCAFCFTSPVRLRPAALATLRIYRAADDAAITLHPSCGAVETLRLVA